MGCYEGWEAAQELSEAQITTGPSCYSHGLHIRPGRALGGGSMPRWLHTDLGPQQKLCTCSTLILHLLPILH